MRRLAPFALAAAILALPDLGPLARGLLLFPALGLLARWTEHTPGDPHDP
ncbi:hypothetical protein KTR66_16670 [Roseococcus sp. SDR]|nr:hypothetical protein [Roseococcus sp. SDR]MBS7791639.1 hypothetical protein [Roseococcus sp. SDR]MBV1846953.1 hypothetical protein [Roseococcus sp. SDR]